MNDKAHPGAGHAAQQFGHFWARRTQRERVLMALTAAGLLLVALLTLAILPAWRMLQAAPQEMARADAQWQRMQVLQAQSAALLQQPKREFNEAALRASLAPLGTSAQLQVGQTSAELRLQSAAPDALAQWLLSSRRESGAVVREAQLQRSPPLASSSPNRITGTGGSTDQSDSSRWSGRLLLDLPR
jgi:type II secretory pathway component PulM